MDMGVQILEIEIGVGIRGGRRQRRGSEILVGRRETEEGLETESEVAEPFRVASYISKMVESIASSFWTAIAAEDPGSVTT
nr:hypothetical protein Iba_chr10fCG8510 [Ipomoea batatas]